MNKKGIHDYHFISKLIWDAAGVDCVFSDIISETLDAIVTLCINERRDKNNMCVEEIDFLDTSDSRIMLRNVYYVGDGIGKYNGNLNNNNNNTFQSFLSKSFEFTSNSIFWVGQTQA